MRVLPRRISGEGLILTIAVALAGDPVHGAQIAALAGCASCHTVKDGLPFAGGYALETRFGTFYGPNITPGGLSDWDDATFRRAMHGKSPRGYRYYPAFPWTSFRAMTDADLSDLWAYLQALPPSNAPNRHHALRGVYGWRSLLVFWNPTEPPAPKPGTERGAYLANAVLHCAECHTPRTGLGNLRPRHWLEGTDQPPEPAPDITNLGWSSGDWDDFLTSAMTPDGDILGGQMERIIDEGTSHLSVADRAALVDYVRALP
jgi:mono/diheme cytochrome c family protein